MKNSLSIRLYGEQVGVLEQDSAGRKVFTYDSNVITPISVGMPIREEPYDDLPCEAFFGGLLPESEKVKNIIGKRFGISPNNSFSLLKAIGYDCAGAISCHAIDEPIIHSVSVPLSGRIISEAELYEHIIELPRKPLFMDVEGLRLSLAGVQEKAAICLIENRIAFPENGCPTTHILKPASPDFEEIVENEYFLLKIAKHVGLPVPGVTLKKIKDIIFLLIERYDRQIQGNKVERIHQEDFCQALGVPSFKKHENEGGHSLEDCFKLLNKTKQPAINRNLLASAIVFNYLISNMDAHGKNFSLLHNKSNISLAPFYDLVCTRVYEKLTSKMAMKIGSKYSADKILPRHWQQLSEKVNYRYLAIKNLLEQMGSKIKKFMIEEEEKLKASGVNSIIISKIKNHITTNIDQTLERFS